MRSIPLVASLLLLLLAAPLVCIAAEVKTVSLLDGRVTFEVPLSWIEAQREDNGNGGSVFFRIPNPDAVNAAFKTAATIYIDSIPAGVDVMDLPNVAHATQCMFDSCVILKDFREGANWRGVMARGQADRPYVILQRIGVEHGLAFDLTMAVPVSDASEVAPNGISSILEAFNLLSESIKIRDAASAPEK